MDTLKRAGFGELFGAAFTVTATFQLALGLLGIVLAVLSPGLFRANGAPATNFIQAVGVDIFLVVILLLMNAMASAAGAGLLVLLRPLLFRKAAEA